MFEVGPYRFTNPVALAPMAGITDAPFRTICRRFGVQLTFSEMTLANEAVWHSRKSRLRCDFRHDPEPVVVQIAGAEPEALAEAARYQLSLGAHWIDINMGCPAKKVCRKAAGSALLSDPALVGDILAAVCEAAPLVSLKIRTGPEPRQRNAVEIATIAEQAGVQLLSIHGRTRAERFQGQAEYRTIREVCRNTALPVLANGDISTPEQACRVMEWTGAAGLLIGRATLGRSWLLQQMQQALAGKPVTEPDWTLKIQTLLDHLQAIHAFYGEAQGVRMARKHVGWYLEAHNLQHLRRPFMQMQDAQEQLRWLKRHLLHDACA